MFRYVCVCVCVCVHMQTISRHMRVVIHINPFYSGKQLVNRADMYIAADVRYLHQQPLPRVYLISVVCILRLYGSAGCSCSNIGSCLLHGLVAHDTLSKLLLGLGKAGTRVPVYSVNLFE